MDQFIVDVSQGKIQAFYNQQKQKQNRDQQKQKKKIKYEHVLSLTSQTYNQTLKSSPYIFIQYYSPSCGHCMQFAPQYQSFAQKLKEQQSRYVIAAVDMVGNRQIGQYVSVNGYPTLRFYVDGDQFQYQGERKGQKIKEWMDEVVDAKVKVIDSVQEMQKPGVVIFGLKEDHNLQRIGIKFNRYPVFSVKGQSQFKIEIHDGKFAQYTGDQNIDAVWNWLQQKTQQVLIKVAQTQTNRKLNRVLQNQTPLLLLIDRDESNSAKLAKQFLTSFCEDKIEYACGIATKGDTQYQSFNDWIKDPIPQKSRLLYLTTDKFQKYLYQGDIAQLRNQHVEEFIKLVKSGQIHPHDGQKEQGKEQQVPEVEEAVPVEGVPETPEKPVEPKGEDLQTGEAEQNTGKADPTTSEL